MSEPFADHFSEHARDYAAYRPAYPPALFAYLASRCPAHGLAWDCGTGNGQAAVALAQHFTLVHATDPSPAQLAEARPHARVTYRRGRERESGLASGTADLVTAAQAFHWFDGDTFFTEARRVLRPGGVVAIWCYGLLSLGPDVDPIMSWFSHEVVGADWPAGRELVDRLYRDVVLPFDEIAAPPFAIEGALDRDGLIRYVGTWSAVRRHRARTGRDPLPDLGARLASPWGTAAERRRAVWPIGLRVGRRDR